MTYTKVTGYKKTWFIECTSLLRPLYMGDLEIKSGPGGTPRFSRFYSVIRKIPSMERHHLLQYPFQFIIRKTTSHLTLHNLNNFRSYYVRDKHTMGGGLDYLPQTSVAFNFSCYQSWRARRCYCKSQPLMLHCLNTEWLRVSKNTY